MSSYIEVKCETPMSQTPVARSPRAIRAGQSWSVETEATVEATKQANESRSRAKTKRGRNHHDLEQGVPPVKKHVHVVNGDPQIQKLVAKAARAGKLPCRTYETVENLLDSLTEKSQGCIVAGLEQHAETGLPLLEELAWQDISLPVIGLVASSNVELAVSAMHKGAVTVLEVPCPVDVLVDALQIGLSRDKYERRRAVELVRAQAHFDTLTGRERKILALIARGVSNKQIASRLEMRLRTVEAHRGAVFDKMKVESLAELVRLAVLLDALDVQKSANHLSISRPHLKEVSLRADDGGCLGRVSRVASARYDRVRLIESPKWGCAKWVFATCGIHSAFSTNSRSTSASYGLRR